MKRLFLMFALVMGLLLVACGGAEEPATDSMESTDSNASETSSDADTGSDENASATESESADEAEPEPTKEPTKEPTEVPTEEPTEVPEPTVALDAEVQSGEGGFAFQPVSGFELTNEGSFAQMMVPGGNDDVGPMIGVFGLPIMTDEMSLDSMFTDFASNFGENVELSEPASITVNGTDGLVADFSGDPGDGEVKGRLAGFGNDAQLAFVVGFAPAAEFDEVLSAEFDAVVQTFNLIDIVMPELESLTDGESEDTATEDAATEDTATEDAETSEQGATGDAGETDSKATEDAETSDDGAMVMELNGDPGMACFGTAGFGLSCISAEGEWMTYTEENSDLASDYIYDLEGCADGSLLIASSPGIQRFDGTEFRLFEGDWGFSSPDAVSCTQDGNFWVAHYQGVSYFDGSAWTTYGSENLNTNEDELLYDIIVDGMGNVWAMTPNALSRFDGNEWTIFEDNNGLDDEYYFDRFAIDPSGQPWALSGDTLLQFDGSAWTTYESGDFFIGEDLAFAQDGTAYISTFADGVYNFDGSSWGATSTDDGLAVERTDRIAFDANGRLYVTTAFGLNIWDGASWVHYTMDSGELLNNKLNSVVVFNGGPALPAAVDKENGSVIGNVEIDGAPAADSTVELCGLELYSSFRGETPCSDMPWFRTIQTDADGNFTFDDVPVGYYYIVFEGPDGWIKITDEFGLGASEIPVAEGEATDLGTLTSTTE